MAAWRACRLAGGVHRVAERLCGPCDHMRLCAIVLCVEWGGAVYPLTVVGLKVRRRCIRRGKP
eukprot:573579-Pleurochrysis_carterae.AAC.2